MVIIRADGNAKIGMGHLMRCLTIADAVLSYTEHKENICFFCAEESSAEVVRERGFQAEVLCTPYQDMGQEIPLWEQFFVDKKCQNVTILVDSYYVTNEYVKAIGRFGSIYLLDDLGKTAFSVDFIINYNVFAREEDYSLLYQDSSTKCFLGGSYVPIREQFLNRNYVPKKEVKRVLITTGGGDIDNITGAIVNCLYCADYEFHVVVGRYYPHLEELKRLAEEKKGIYIHHDVKDMAGLMEHCDLAITAGGTTIYELAAIGVPLICFSYAENQEALTEYIGKENIAGYAGAYHKDAEDTLRKMKELFVGYCENEHCRRKAFLAEQKMIDGQGAKRIAKCLCPRERRNHTALLYGLFAVVIFELLWIVTGGIHQGVEERREVTMMMMGDSILADCMDETSIDASLSERLGMEIFNGALGGTTMARIDDTGRYELIKDGLSMHAFAQSIVADDFRVQQSILIREPVTEYFSARIDQIEAIDFEKIDVLLIEHGINDYHAAVPIEDLEDPDNIYTYKGALRQVITMLREEFPDMRIILLTPTYTWYRPSKDSLVSCEEYDLGGGILEDYVKAELEVARELGVEIVDLYHDLYEHEELTDWEQSTWDGLHPNAYGRELIVNRLYEYLQEHDEKDMR